MAEVCPKGHIRTEANTRWHKYGRGDKLKRVCLDCKKLRNTGKPAAHEQQIQRTTELHEDIEDLLKFGATFEEIIQRSGYSNWDRMRKSLKSRERNDLIEQMRKRRGAVPNQTTPLRGKPGKKKQGNIRPSFDWAHDLPEGLEFDWSGYSLQTPA